MSSVYLAKLFIVLHLLAVTLLSALLLLLNLFGLKWFCFGTLCNATFHFSRKLPCSKSNTKPQETYLVSSFTTNSKQPQLTQSQLNLCPVPSKQGQTQAFVSTSDTLWCTESLLWQNFNSRTKSPNTQKEAAKVWDMKRKRTAIKRIGIMHILALIQKKHLQVFISDTGLINF